MNFVVKAENGHEEEQPTRAEADARVEEIKRDFGMDAFVETSESAETDGGTLSDPGGTEIVDHSPDEDLVGVDECVHCGGEISDGHCPDCEGDTPAPAEETTEALDKLGESIENDPLNVLPGYMITMVDGEPSLNKRGVSVLAYHYDISITEREVVAYPHEHDYETAVVEIMVEGGNGRTFSGVGEAHVDETPKHQLLRMAETRAYKRAVIFATGTGIVSYQEMTGQLEEGR